MFSQRENDFLLSELKKLSCKIEERLDSPKLSDTQRPILEKRLILANSIQRKIDHEKKRAENYPKKTPPILVIDDADFALQVNKQCLMQVGFKKIDTAKDGEAGLKRMKDAADLDKPYGLVICDWEMPKMSGLELLKAVRNDEQLWSTPFYLLSSRDQKSDILQAINLGATGYITKPVNTADLDDKFKEYIIGP